MATTEHCVLCERAIQKLYTYTPPPGFTDLSALDTTKSPLLVSLLRSSGCRLSGTRGCSFAHVQCLIPLGRFCVSLMSFQLSALSASLAENPAWMRRGMAGYTDGPIRGVF
ncbi:hypothetical protein GDO78_022708 [Eleutherodactylus coqui]|uniref:Uncharacterized protein n=1 Tax=Eleutherodactylus coqui TaxID=57060 RepID=A0A8J6EFX5_ELECQ|nr:hypothetical protein GDO78_022708 [Eleutherodactylus coqui]